MFTSHVNRMEFKTFSCFDNFVRGNNAGVPDHTPMNHALQHLEKYDEFMDIKTCILIVNHFIKGFYRICHSVLFQYQRMKYWTKPPKLQPLLYWYRRHYQIHPLILHRRLRTLVIVVKKWI